jgi:hypothetical protein
MKPTRATALSLAFAGLALLSGCQALGVAPRPVAASEVARLRALPDAKEAAIAAPGFYRDALETVSRLQTEAERARP